MAAGGHSLLGQLDQLCHGDPGSGLALGADELGRCRAAIELHQDQPPPTLHDGALGVVRYGAACTAISNYDWWLDAIGAVRAAGGVRA